MIEYYEEKNFRNKITKHVPCLASPILNYYDCLLLEVWSMDQQNWSHLGTCKMQNLGPPRWTY